MPSLIFNQGQALPYIFVFTDTQGDSDLAGGISLVYGLMYEIPYTYPMYQDCSSQSAYWPEMYSRFSANVTRSSRAVCTLPGLRLHGIQLPLHFPTSVIAHYSVFLPSFPVFDSGFAQVLS